MKLKNGIGLKFDFYFYFDNALVSREAVAYRFDKFCKSSFEAENLCKCCAETLGYDFFAVVFIPQITFVAAACE